MKRKTDGTGILWANGERKWLKEARGNKCELCGKGNSDLNKKGLPIKLIFHHLKPVRSGGIDDCENLQLLCNQCHSEIHLTEREELCIEEITQRSWDA